MIYVYNIIKIDNDKSLVLKVTEQMPAFNL